MKGTEHVDEVHAWIIRDVDGTEGIPAVRVTGFDFPVMLMTAGTAQGGAIVGKMGEWAAEVAKHLEPGMTMTHAVFSSRFDLERLG